MFYRLRLAGPFGIGFTTVSLFGLYALLYGSRSWTALLWGTGGAIVAAASLVALVWISAHSPALTGTDNGGPYPLMNVSVLLVWWVRPVGIMVFGVAAMLADLKGPWEYVLFAIGLLETPLPALALRSLTGTNTGVGWQALVFGVPGMQAGLIGVLAWLVLAGALYASWHELDRRAARRRRDAMYFPGR